MDISNLVGEQFRYFSVNLMKQKHFFLSTGVYLFGPTQNPGMVEFKKDVGKSVDPSPAQNTASVLSQLLRAASSQDLNISQDMDPTVSLGNLFQYLIVPMVNIFLPCNQIFLFSSF